MFQTRSISLSLLFCASFAVIALFPWAQALATVTTLGGQTEQLGRQIYEVPKLIAVACYVIGTFFAARSLLALKGFIEDPDDNPITKFLSLSVTAALLISLPYIIVVMKNSLDIHAYNISSTSDSFSDDGGHP